MTQTTYSKLKSAFNAEQLGALLDKQALLDADIKTAHDIKEDRWENDMYIEHLLALRIELAEFINEAHYAWKYWKKKPVNRDKMIGEAVDCIHFIMLILNKTASAAGDTYPARRLDQINGLKIQAIDTSSEESMKKDIKYKLFELSMATPQTSSTISLRNYAYKTLVRIALILDIFDFDTDAIMAAYDAKNIENFKRIKENY